MDRGQLVRTIVRSLPELDEETLEDIMDVIRLARGREQVALEAPVPLLPPRLPPREEEVPLLDDSVEFFRNLLDQEVFPDAAIRQLDEIQAQNHGARYQNALNHAFTAAIQRGPNGGRHLNFAHYLVNERDFDDVDYFTELVEGGDFEAANILEPKIESEDLERILEEILRHREQMLAEGEPEPEFSRAAEEYIRNLLLEG